MVGPIKQDFWPKIHILERNHSKKMCMTLENKVSVSKLEVIKMIVTKNVRLNYYLYVLLIEF